MQHPHSKKKSRSLALLVAVAASLVCPSSWTAAQQSRLITTVRISANDEADKPVADVIVELKLNGAVAGSATTDDKGEARFTNVAPGTYEVAVSKDGIEPLTQSDVTVTAGATIEIKFTIIPKIKLSEEVSVKAGEAAPIDKGASPSTELGRSTIKALPDKPATVADTLPLVPGVVRSPEGQLRISGSGEHRSALVVNAADVTDPATGQFGVTVPVDSVETVNVFKTPYLAQYGRFTAGVVSVETRRGGDKWSWELNDPLPEFRIRSGHLQGLREASPRLTFNGPLIPNRLYISEGVEYEITKRPVRQLPFPFNESKRESINSFSQFDVILSPLHTLTGTFHLAPRSQSFVNLDFFNPQEVTPTFRAHDYTGTIIDRLTIGSNLLEGTVAIKRYDGRVWGQGRESMVLTPLGNRGNYFSQQDRRASRVEWLETFSLAPISHYGAHNLKFGSSVARTTNRGEFLARTVDIRDEDDLLLKRIEFTGGRPFNRHDLELAFFGQDHWVITPKLALDLGTRFERQGITETVRIAPRIGFAWTPLGSVQTVIRAGVGFFYDRVPLGVYSFDRYPEQVVTTFGPGGEIIDGPRLFANITDRAEASRFPFVFNKRNVGNFAPYSATWNVEVEHPLTRMLRVRANYLSSNSYGIITVTPKVVQGRDALVLGGGGKMRYRQLELIAKLAWSEGREMLFSYVRSHSQGDLNEFNNYLGNFPYPIVRRNQYTNLPGDLPNRFLAWGLIRLPWKMRVAPIVEYRNGFPYAVVDAGQDYVGVPNSDRTRFPNFYSLDARVSKDFQVSKKYTLRLSVTGYNITNHFNPAVVRNNIADRDFGTFFGNTRRRLRLDFDVIF